MGRLSSSQLQVSYVINVTMSTESISSSANAKNEEIEAITSFLSDVLRPGSSLSPVFLAVVDCVLGLLLLILISLLWLTNYNIHFFGLITAEIALWLSIKWSVYNLDNFFNDIDRDVIIQVYT